MNVVGKAVREEIMIVLKKIIGGKTAGMNDIVVEFLKSRSFTITDWLLRIFNRSLESGVIPKDWEVACIVPIYKGKCDRREYVNSKRISILDIPAKIFGRVLVSIVMENTKKQGAKEQGGFRSGRGCIDQISVLKQLI